MKLGMQIYLWVGVGANITIEGLKRLFCSFHRSRSLDFSTWSSLSPFYFTVPSTTVAPSPTPPAVAPSPTPPAVAPSPTPPAVIDDPPTIVTTSSGDPPVTEPVESIVPGESPAPPNPGPSATSPSSGGSDGTLAAIGVVVALLVVFVIVVVVLVILFALRRRNKSREKFTPQIQNAIENPNYESEELHSQQTLICRQFLERGLGYYPSHTPDRQPFIA